VLLELLAFEEGTEELEDLALLFDAELIDLLEPPLQAGLSAAGNALPLLTDTPRGGGGRA
jgi:hypothetical protein